MLYGSSMLHIHTGNLDMLRDTLHINGVAVAEFTVIKIRSVGDLARHC